MLLASNVYGQVVILDPGFTNPPTVEIAGNNTACLGQQQTFYAYQRNDYSKANCDSGVYTWSTDDSYATVTPDAYDPSIVQINWSSSGRHNVYVSLNPCFLIADNSPSQGPGASFEVDVHDAPNQPTVSVIDGVTNNTTATGTTICEGREIELTVPANTDYTWSWSGSFITRQFNERSIYVKPLSTTTYTLTATPKSGSICPIPTTSFTVTVLPRPAAPIITGTTRLGDGTLTLQVSAPLSGGIYVWYLSQSDYQQHRPIEVV